MTTHTWIDRRFRVMGADGHLMIAGGSAELADWAMAQLDAFDRCWGATIESDLGALNRDPRETVTVPPLLFQALDRAVLGWLETDALFDPVEVHEPALRSPGRLRPRSEPPTQGLRAVRLDRDRRRVTRPVGLRFDLAGFDRALAVDEVVTELLSRGAVGASCALGSAVRMGGLPPEMGWVVPIADPKRTGENATIAELPTGGAVVMARATPVSGPKTGRVQAATVVHDTAWFADVLAVAAVTSGMFRSSALLRQHQATSWLALDDDSLVEVVAPRPTAGAGWAAGSRSL